MANQGRRRRRSGKHFPTVNANAAGVDIGSRKIWVSVPAERAEERTGEFETFTGDLYSLACWLQECKIETVAMGSTGVYWIPLFNILEERGLEVLLTNARDVKNVSGRKTDVIGCEWIQQLHTFGLLRPSFSPDLPIRVLRAYSRQRETLIRLACDHVNRMQKALAEMNLLLQNVISDFTRVTGRRILDGILGGERDPVALATVGLVWASEAGFDMTRWKTDKHFGAWFNLAPNPKITGGRRLRSPPKRNKNRLAHVLKVAAQSLSHSRSALGANYRRLRARLGPQRAIKAMAYKLARILYRMIRHGEPFREIGPEEYESRFQGRTLKNLKRRVRSLGYKLVPAQPNHATGDVTVS